MREIPVALQMYTLRNESEKDLRGTLKKVAEIGYQGVEFAGYFGHEANEIKSMLDQFNLEAASSHIRLDLLEGDLERTIEFENAIGNQRIVCPVLPEEQRNVNGYNKLIGKLNRIGERCQQKGMTFSYHNHAFELERINGRPVLEMILEETNPEWVKAELDIYWLQKANEDPVEWMKRYHDRTPLIHLKDMTTDEEKMFAELGTGGINLEKVLDQGQRSHVEWWVVEQDKCLRSPFESVEMSMKFLKDKAVV